MKEPAIFKILSTFFLICAPILELWDWQLPTVAVGRLIFSQTGINI